MSSSNKKVVPKEFIGPFILVTSLFALWGFANDITNPLVAAFKTVFDNLSNAKVVPFNLLFMAGMQRWLYLQRYLYKNFPIKLGYY